MNEPAIRFGAVYFRTSSPPQTDWEKDYQTAAMDGHNTFRHWFSWNAIERAPGKFSWSDFDRQLDLGVSAGISTIIAEMAIDTPEWLYAANPSARIELCDGSKRRSAMHGSSATGGHYCLCLDDPDIRRYAERFLRRLARRYKDHPGLYGYDVWNECTYYSPDRFCYCPATQIKFRVWLKDRYGDLDSLARSWGRFSLTSWDQVELPREFSNYPETYDAARFREDSAIEQLRWRYDTLRSEDTVHPIGAHGNARGFNDIATAAGDDFRAAAVVDFFGYTHYYGSACDPFLAGDYTRGASGGKTFWRAEAIGDAAWYGRSAFGPPLPEKDSLADPANIRLDFLISLAAGARGYFNPRWRPLLTGPLFASYGWYGMDGSPTERSAQAAELATWAHDETLSTLWRARPVRGEAAILILADAQTASLAMSGLEHSYAHYYSLCVQGIHAALLAKNVQCDFIDLANLPAYHLVFLPYPLSLSDHQIAVLRAWVESGGTLVSEGGFGYFDDLGRVRPDPRSRGFGDFIDARPSAPSFAADMLNGLAFLAATEEPPVAVGGGLLREFYTLTETPPSRPGHEALVQPGGFYEDGSTAVIENDFGLGRIRLAGTMFGYSYHRNPTPATAAWIASALAFSGVEQRIRVDAPGIVARLWEDGARRYVWCVNRNNTQTEADVFPGPGLIPSGEGVVSIRGTACEWSREAVAVRVRIPARDAAIFELVDVTDLVAPVDLQA